MISWRLNRRMIPSASACRLMSVEVNLLWACNTDIACWLYILLKHNTIPAEGDSEHWYWRIWQWETISEGLDVTYQRVIHNVSSDAHCHSCNFDELFHELLHILVNVHVVWSVEKCEVFMNIHAYLLTTPKGILLFWQFVHSSSHTCETNCVRFGSQRDLHGRQFWRLGRILYVCNAQKCMLYSIMHSQNFFRLIHGKFFCHQSGNYLLFFSLRSLLS